MSAEVPRRYDVYRTPEAVLVVVIQSDLLEAITTRVVAPLLPRGTAGRGLQSLNPEVIVEGEPLLLMPQLLATLTTAELGTRIASLAENRDAITRALDALLSGI